MNRLFIFFKNIYLFLIFTLIEVGALVYYSKSSQYANTQLVNAQGFFSTKIFGAWYNGAQYFSLEEQNQSLSATIAQLENELDIYRQKESEEVVMSDVVVDSLIAEQLYSFCAAKVVDNSISSQHNFITINKGRKDGIKKDMSLMSSDGCVVGYVISSTENYSVAASILNLNFKSSGMSISGDYFGSIHWDGVRSDEVLLDDVPKYAKLEVGDTIVTTEFSRRFPSGVKIGTISEFEMLSQLNYRARVKLFTNMNKLYEVIAIEHKFKDEIDELEGVKQNYLGN